MEIRTLMQLRPALAVLAGILALVATPAPAKSPVKHALYGAIAVNRGTRAFGYSYDYRTARDAKREALKRCGEPKCEVVVSFRNGCAAAATGKGKPATSTGVTREEAEAKVLRRCGPDCKVLAWACTTD